MSTHLSAVASRIQALGLDVYDTEAERPFYDPRDWTVALSEAAQDAWTLPDRYALLGAPTLRQVPVTVDGATVEVRDYVQITLVGLSATQVRHWNRLTRDVLDRQRFDVGDTHRAYTRVTASGVVASDKAVDPHRFYSVDTYRYLAAPK